MKKTLTINLGGIVFHIDEDAYDLLRSYLEKLKVRFNQESANEIISDIENRMAEMFNEQKSFDRYVISKDDVQRVIEVMGNPDDIAGEETGQERSSHQHSQNTSYKNINRRFFRNPDDKILGGVCSGISAYFNIDPVWLRLLMALSIIFAGTGIMIYIILWIIIPEASTPLEKMQMRGEELNISNIERNIKNEMEGVKNRMQSFGNNLTTSSNKDKVRNGIQRIFGALGDFILLIVKFIGLIIGAVFSLAAIVVLAILSIILFMAIGWIPASDSNIIGHQFLSQIFSTNQLSLLSMGVLVVVSLPVLVLLLNGLKILFKVNLNLKKIGAVLSAFWIIGIFIVVYQGIELAKEFNSKAVVSTKVPLALSGKKH
jgi:phage shock protein PspC (stress-responsive transcriptional regulator)